MEFELATLELVIIFVIVVSAAMWILYRLFLLYVAYTMASTVIEATPEDTDRTDGYLHLETEF